MSITTYVFREIRKEILRLRNTGVMGNRGIMSFISGEYKSKNERKRGTNVILGSGEHRKLRL